jgi:hypothetical protein
MNRICLAIWGLATAAALGPACATGAIGIRECREVETLRCQAEAECGVINDVAACERYVRDHCLHGIAGPSVPTRPEQDGCLGLVESAQKCASDDPQMLASECGEFDKGALSTHGGARPARSVCDVISRPWDFRPCAFLNLSGQGGAGGEDNQ